MFKRFPKVTGLLSVLLLVGLVVLLTLFSAITRRLPSQVYTREQALTLSNARGRAISQAPLTTNLYVEAEMAQELDSTVGLEGAIQNELGQLVLPVRFSRWENTVMATLDARYEEQNNVSVTVYDLDFESIYRVEYPEDGVTTTLELIFPFPQNLETLNGVQFVVDGKEEPNAEYTPERIRWSLTIEPGATREFSISYRADGVSSFSYGLNQGRRTEMLDVIIDVKGLTGSEIPQYALRTTDVVANESGGQTFKWQYDNLVVNRDIALTLPSRLSFAQRVAALQNDFALLANLAPFWVILFLLSIGGLFRLDGRQFPFPAFLMMGLSFALFYPLLTFLSGLVGLVAAAFIALALIVGLLLLFIRFAVGERRAYWQLGWLLFIFLGVLSLGLLLPTRGLMLTLGGFFLIGTFMVAYARRPPSPPPPDIPEPSPAEPIEPTPEIDFEEQLPEAVTEPTLPDALEISIPQSEPDPEPPPQFVAYCPQCGRGLEGDYAFCPGCGHDGQDIVRCGNCDHAQVIQETNQVIHCVNCGELID